MLNLHEGEKEEIVYDTLKEDEAHRIINSAQKSRLESEPQNIVKEIARLVIEHSSVYLAKFLFLNFAVALPSCCMADTHGALFTTFFTFTGCLVFDMLTKGKLPEEFDTSKVKTMCAVVTGFVFIMFAISTTILLIQEKLLGMSLGVLKVVIWLLLLAASFSAIVEAVVKLPSPVLPKEQERTVGD